MKKTNWLYAISGMLLLSIPVFADQPDVDGNGFNDVLGITISDGSSKDVTWQYLPAGSGVPNVTTNIEEFGKKQNIRVPGRYSNQEMTDIAVVRQNEGGALEWRIRTQSGSIQSISFGSNDDTVFGGIDIDGDGFDDLVTRNKNSVFSFRRTGLSSNTDTTTVSQRIGKAKDSVFFFDIDRDNDDDLCRISSSNAKKKRNKKKNRKKKTVCFDFLTKARVFSANAGKKANGTPKPLGSDLLSFIRKTGKKNNKSTIVRVQDLNGKLVANKTFSGNVNVIVPAPGVIAAISGQQMEVFTPATNQTSFQPAPASQILLDEYNTGKFRQKKETPSTNCNSTRAWGAGAVWKPISEGDGRLVILDGFGANSTRAFITNSSGTVIENGVYNGKTNENRPTFRFSRRGSDFGSNIIAVFQTGNSNVCRNVPNGGSRYD